MTEREEMPDVKDVLFAIDDNHEEILQSVREQYGLSDEDAWTLYRHLLGLYSWDCCSLRYQCVQILRRRRLRK